MSNKKDYATSTVLTAPSPADSGTSLVVQSGHGARFPAAPFYVTVHPPSEFPTLDNAEKLLVSNKSTDTFTIDRAEGDTSAQEIEAGWRVSNSVFLDDFPDTFDDLADGTTNKAFTGSEKTKLSGIETAADVTDATNVGAAGAFMKSVDDMDDITDGSTYKKYSSTEKTKLAGIETAADVTDATNVDAAGATMNSDTNVKSNSWVLDQDNMSGDDDTKVPTQQSVKAYVDAAITAAKAALLPVGSIVVLGVSTNPNTLYGFGTWTAITDRVIVGKGSSGTFATLDATGGAETHTLTITEMPAHTHSYTSRAGTFTYANGGLSDVNFGNSTPNTGSTGGGGAHNNLQPYIVKYIWQRTA